MTRSCDECTYCCTAKSVDALGKPAGTPCQHLGRGCTIYEDRPGECRAYNCGWLLHDDVPEAYRPDRSHVILEFASDRSQVVAITDDVTPLRDWLVGLGIPVIVVETLNNAKGHAIVNGEDVPIKASHMDGGKVHYARV